LNDSTTAKQLRLPVAASDDICRQANGNQWAVGIIQRSRSLRASTHVCSVCRAVMKAKKTEPTTDSAAGSVVDTQVTQGCVPSRHLDFFKVPSTLQKSSQTYETSVDSVLADLRIFASKT